MKTSSNLQGTTTAGQKPNMSSWTAGPIISSYDRKGFNREGVEMKTVDMKTYILEVFPPAELAGLMQQPSPDVASHLQHEGAATRCGDESVSFLAQVSLPCRPDDSTVEITLISEQRQNGGIYKQEITIPRHMLSVKPSPVDTVLDSLNTALHEYNWYPPY